MTETAVGMDARAACDRIRSAMDSYVVSYGDAVPRVLAEIDGTGFFPGASGLWRGREPFGPLPSRFPTAPIMILGHNFDSVAGYELSRKRGIERLKGPTWTYLLQYLERAGVTPEQCFFTNALMGLQATGARGKLKCSDAFKVECRRFLAWQIDFLAPRFIVVLGNDARHVFRYMPDSGVATIELRHPMNLIYAKAAARPLLVAEAATSIDFALALSPRP